jgi:ABC-type glycerol-3-phosphate transport system substrate-binding protein
MSTKKSISRRDFLKASSVLAGAAILAGCCPESEQAVVTQVVVEEGEERIVTVVPTAEPVEPTEEPAPAADAEPTPIVNAFGDCDDPLVVWHGLTGADGAVFAEMLQQFADDTPEVCLRSEGIPWDLFFQKYPTGVAAGTPPDLVIFHAAEVAQMTAEGLMMPMDDIMFDGTLTKDQFNDALMDQITIEGDIMACPFDNHGWVMYYNTMLLENAGMPTDPESLPKNGDEFIEWGLQLTTDVNGNHPGDAGFDPMNVDIWAQYPTWTRYSYPTTMWQFGGGVIGDDGTTATLDQPETIAAIQYWHDMMYKHYICAPWEAYSTWSGDVYHEDRLVFMWEGTWLGGFFRDNPDLEEHTEITWINSLAPDGNQAVKFDSHIFSIPTGVDRDGIDKAKKAMLHLLNNGAYWTNAGQVPALLSVQQSPEVQAVKGVRVASEEFNAIGRTDLTHPAFIEIQTAYETALGNAFADPDNPVDQAMIDGNAAVQAILDRP